MRASHLICVAAAVLMATALPASADCLEDVETLELSFLQAEPIDEIDDPNETPSRKARAAMPKPVSDQLREAEVAARAGNEVQCFATLQTALRILSGF